MFFAGCNEEMASAPGLRSPASPAEAKFLQGMAASGQNLSPEIEIPLGKNISIEFVLIPSGEFHMGSPNTESLRQSDEGPLHQVKISKSFYMGKYEVTQLQYNTVVGTQKDCHLKGDNLPVEEVDFFEVNSFLFRLSGKYGLKFRLPTEAEWEYACRAGTNTPFYTGETISASQANYDSRYVYGMGSRGIYLKMTAPVGSYPPNAFGLYDMHGNVWEWCSDWYISTYYHKMEMIDPVGPSDGHGHVIRGGSWNHDPKKLRSADRNSRRSGADRKLLGFRAVLEIPNSGSIKIPASVENIDTNSTHVQTGTKSEKAQFSDIPPKVSEPVEFEYNAETKMGYISVKGKGPEARAWMLKQIGEICASKNIVIQEGTTSEPARFRVLSETFMDGKFTMKFEVVR